MEDNDMSDAYAWAEDRPARNDPHVQTALDVAASRLMRDNPGLQYTDAQTAVAQYVSLSGSDFSAEGIARASMEPLMNGSPHTIVHPPVRLNWTPDALRLAAAAMVKGGASPAVHATAAIDRQAADQLPVDSAQLEKEQERMDYNRRYERACNDFATNGGDWAFYRKKHGLYYNAVPRQQDNDLHAPPPGHEKASQYMRQHPGMQYVDALAYVNGGDVVQYG
jgi:hypothetical protein